MNNWRLLLFAVVAVLQPIGSFTEKHLIDGRPECCDRRSNSLTQEARLYGNFHKTIPEDRRLDYQGDFRKDHSEARDNPIRSRERLSVKSTERRVSESADRFSSETRSVNGQQRRERSVDSRQTREDQTRRIRESISRDSLSQYERDDLGFRRNRMSRDDTRIRRISNERAYQESFGPDDTRKVRDSKALRRVSVNRETVVDRRGREDVARDESRSNFRISNYGAENILQQKNNRESRNLNRRERENSRVRSLETRVNSVERDNYRTSFRAMSERDDERRQNSEARDKTVDNVRDSSERIFVDRRRLARDAIERVNQNRRNTRDYRTDYKIEIQRQDDSRLPRERSSERRESRLNAERKMLFSYESRMVNADDHRSERIGSNDRREVPVSSVETRDERRQPSTRSLDRVKSYDREFTARILERNLRDVRSVRNRREVRHEEILDERRERHETRMSKNRYITKRESGDNAPQRAESRSTVRLEANVRLEQESRLRERDNVRSDENRDRDERLESRKQTFNRIARNTERRQDGQLGRASRFTERSYSEERTSRISEERHNSHREANDINRARTIVIQRLTRADSAPHRRSDVSRIELKIRRQRAPLVDSTISRDRISMSRISTERIERREAQETTRDSRVDTRNEITRKRGVLMDQNVESRLQKDKIRSRDHVSQNQARDILAARSSERRSRESYKSNDRDIRIVTRISKAVESRRGTRRIMVVQPNRYNLAMERMDRTANRGLRIESKQRSFDIARTKDFRIDTRREDIGDARFRNNEAKFRESDPIHTSDNQNSLNWQILFYALQGAYLCGMLMQMLNEKPNKGKARNITTWWYSPKDLVKVD